MTTIPNILKERADALLKWPGTQELGGSDVLAWVWPDSTFGFAIKGSAKTIQRRSLSESTYPINNYRLMREIQLQNLMGLDARLESGSSWVGIRGGIGQNMSSGKVCLDEAMSTIRSILSSSLNDADVSVTLMPLEGSPWHDYGEDPDCFWYYSAGKKKEICGRRPLTTKVNTMEGIVPGVDFCHIAPRIKEVDGDIVGTIDGKDRLFLTRCINVSGDRQQGEIISSIKECGGMLYPSLSLSRVPATNFGILAMFARLPLALKSIKPTKQRGWPVSVYNTDAWTGNIKFYTGRASAELYQQLTGQWEPYENSYMHVLGPSLETDMPSGDLSIKKADTVSAIRSRLKRLDKLWKRGMSKDEIEELSYMDRGNDKYPYLEVKANAVVDIDSFPLAVYGNTRNMDNAGCGSFLRGVGFRGEILVLDISEDLNIRMAMGDSSATWEYAWLIRDAVLEFTDYVHWIG